MTSIISVLEDVRDLIISSLPTLQDLRYDITWKADGSPVTRADIFLENAIADLLRKHLGEISFIGEESYSEDALISAEWVAVLDPIDGTENFCSGLKEWGTSLSIWQNGEHRGSMLMMPELGECMMTTNIPRIPQSRIIGYSSSFHPEIGRGLAEDGEGRIMGCAVYNLFNVIRGAFSRFINPKGACSWDLLAGVALAQEAGCIVYVNGEIYDGRFLEPNQKYRVDIQHRYDIYPR